MHADEGLVVIDPEDYKIAVDQAKANLAPTQQRVTSMWRRVVVRQKQIVVHDESGRVISHVSLSTSRSTEWLTARVSMGCEADAAQSSFLHQQLGSFGTDVAQRRSLWLAGVVLMLLWVLVLAYASLRFRLCFVAMCGTCKYASNMVRMIQVRNVPDSLHRNLKARAALSGMSLSEYLLREFREIAERPTLSELRERLHACESLPVAIDTARFMREERAVR